MLTPGVSNSIF